MALDLGPAKAFGALLRENADAAQFYDSRTQAQKQAILLQLGSVGDMTDFVRHLPETAP